MFLDVSCHLVLIVLGAMVTRGGSDVMAQASKKLANEIDGCLVVSTSFEPRRVASTSEWDSLRFVPGQDIPQLARLFRPLPKEDRSHSWDSIGNDATGIKNFRSQENINAGKYD